MVQVFLGEPVSDFETIDDLKNCTIASKSICVPETTNDGDFWKASIAPPREKCKKRNRNPEFLNQGTDGGDVFSQGLAKVANPKDKCNFFLASKTTLSTAAQTSYCGTLSVVGKEFSPNSLSFLLPKGSPYTAPLSAATLDLQTRGKIQDPISFAVSSPCKRQIETQTSWRQLDVFFYASWTLLVVLLIVMCIANIFGTMREGRERAENASVEMDP